MRLSRIAVEGVGRFAARTVVEGLGPGVNVLAADNEAGKSTLFRAVRTCLFSRHTSKDKGVRALATDGRELPVRIAVTFEAEGAAWEISKTFLRTPRSLLTRNGERFAEGDAADEKVWRLLGLEPGSGRASLDEAAYGLLWVEQGKSFEALAVTEGAAGALSDAIQQEVGTLVGGDRARRALAQLDEALDRELTARDQAKAGGRLATAQAALRKAEADFADASARLAAMNDSLDRLARLKADLARESDPAVVRSQEEAARAASATLERMRAAANELRAAETAEAQARALLDAAQTALADAQTRAQRIDAAQARLADLTKQMKAEETTAAQQRTALTRLRAETEATDSRLGELDDLDRRLRGLDEALDADRRRDGLVRRIEALRIAGEALGTHTAALAANQVTDTVTGELDSILRDQQTLEAQIAAAATVATITVTGETRVTIAGEAVAGSRTQPITEATLIEAPGVLISLAPPTRNEEAARKRRQEERRKLDSLLARHDVVSPAALREKAAARRALQQNEAMARAALSGLGVDESSLANTLATERAALAAIMERVAQALAETGADALPSPEEIAARRKGAEEERAGLRQKRATASGQIEVINSRLQELAGRLGEWRGEKGRLGEQLDADLAALPDDARAGELQRRADDAAAKARAHGEALEALAAVRRNAPDADAIERAAIDAQRREQARDNHRRRLDDLRVEAANLEGQIDAQGGDGLGERVAELGQQLALATADHARISHRIETLKLLRDTIATTYAERREQLNAPLRRHLAPFLGDVFPAAEVGIGEGFQVAGLTRQGNEDFDRLSGGTREQIAVLVRLAMAALLAERGREAPVILDDALVYCDDERIEQMFTALNRAGRNQQVIVLTCKAGAFQSLGGRPLRLAPG
jgi:chromosome segregation ATPase